MVDPFLVPVYEFRDLIGPLWGKTHKLSKYNGVRITYELQNDIKVAEYGAIQSLCSEQFPFISTLDGKDYALKNMRFDSLSENAGLFYKIGSPGVVRDLHIENISVNVRWWDCGGIASTNLGLISGCSVSGSIQGLSHVGGIVGDNVLEGHIISCSSSANVSGHLNVGGIAGRNGDFGVVEKCYSTGKIVGRSHVGRIVGTNYGKIGPCHATGIASSYLFASGDYDHDESIYTGLIAGRNYGEYVNEQGKHYTNYDLDEVI